MVAECNLSLITMLAAVEQASTAEASEGGCCKYAQCANIVQLTG